MNTKLTITDTPKRFIFDSKSKAERDFWIRSLSRGLEEANLRLDFERPLDKPGPEETVRLSFPKALGEELVRIADSSDPLIYAFLLAGLNICLQQYTGSHSIVVGSPACLREGAGGQVINALPIVNDIDEQNSFHQFLLKVRDTLEDIYARQEYPLDRIVKDLGIEQPINKCALFDFVLLMTNIHAGMPEVDNDVTITITRATDSFAGEISYRSTLFRKATIERFARHYLAILQEAAKNVDSIIRDLQMLTAAERCQIVIEWNDTKGRDQNDECLHQLFEIQAAAAQDAIAVCYEYEQLTYKELNDRANQLAHYLREVGVGPDVPVGLYLTLSLEMFVGLLGILKAGGAYLPLDSTYPEERVTYMLRDAQVPVVLTQGRLLDQLSKHSPQHICLDSQWETIAKRDRSNPFGRVNSQNLAYVIYTSGSMGRPKGVLVEHQGVCNLIAAQIRAFDLGPDSRVLQFASLGFDASVSEIFTTLVAGGTLVLKHGDVMYSGASLAKVLSDEIITAVTLPPSTLANTPSEDIASLRTVIAAGESCSATMAARWSSRRTFINAYGPTEVTVCASMLRQEEPQTLPPSVGRPIANKHIYLLDNWLRLVAIGVKARLYVGGVGLARGYLNRPDLTAESFIPNPFSDDQGARLYDTGDLAYYVSDGDIMLVGRADRQVKIRGYRIELGEVEAALNQHPAIEEAVVVVNEDNSAGKRLIAYVVSHLSPTPTVTELRSYLAQSLAEYMIPSAFIMMDALPSNSNGKVNLEKLPIPGMDRPIINQVFVPPRTEMEAELAQIFSEVLRIETVGIHDNFFELGGHSLLAIQVVSRVRDKFQVELPVQVIFEAPTISELVIALVQNMVGQVPGTEVPKLLTEIEMLHDSNSWTFDEQN
jgi:amino acid adenylation domain-containing protein